MINFKRCPWHCYKINRVCYTMLHKNIYHFYNIDLFAMMATEGMMNNSHKRILVVDDDLEILELLQHILLREGYMVVCAPNGDEMQAALKRWKVDLIILDVMLGFESGIELCQELRLQNNVPLLLISAISNDKFRINGFNAGADDYIAKPFNPQLLSMRVAAVLRRSKRSTSIEYRTKDMRFEFSGWLLNSHSQELTNAQNVQILLSNGEYKLLTALLLNAPNPLQREELAEHLLNDQVNLEQNASLQAKQSRAIDVQIGRLRQKIEINGKFPKHIKTLRGHGYFFATPVSRVD